MDDRQRILRDLVKGDFSITLHAYERMKERSISERDISQCARNVRSIRDEDGKYIIRGLDASGDELTVICVWDGETLVITAF